MNNSFPTHKLCADINKCVHPSRHAINNLSSSLPLSLSFSLCRFVSLCLQWTKCHRAPRWRPPKTAAMAAPINNRPRTLMRPIRTITITTIWQAAAPQETHRKTNRGGVRGRVACVWNPSSPTTITRHASSVSSGCAKIAPATASWRRMRMRWVQVLKMPDVCCSEEGWESKVLDVIKGSIKVYTRKWCLRCICSSAKCCWLQLNCHANGQNIFKLL